MIFLVASALVEVGSMVSGWATRSRGGHHEPFRLTPGGTGVRIRLKWSPIEKVGKRSVIGRLDVARS
jgi:hypothetical protein